MYHGSTAAQPTVYSKGGGTGLLSCTVREMIVEKTSTRMLYLPKCSRYVVPPTMGVDPTTDTTDSVRTSSWTCFYTLRVNQPVADPIVRTSFRSVSTRMPPTTMLRHCTVKQDGKLNSNWYFHWEKPKI